MHQAEEVLSSNKKVCTFCVPPASGSLSCYAVYLRYNLYKTIEYVSHIEPKDALEHRKQNPLMPYKVEA